MNTQFGLGYVYVCRYLMFILGHLSLQIEKPVAGVTAIIPDLKLIITLSELNDFNSCRYVYKLSETEGENGSLKWIIR